MVIMNKFWRGGTQSFPMNNLGPLIKNWFGSSPKPREIIFGRVKMVSTPKGVSKEFLNQESQINEVNPISQTWNQKEI